MWLARLNWADFYQAYDNMGTILLLSIYFVQMTDSLKCSPASWRNITVNLKTAKRTSSHTRTSSSNM